ncbi:uncharacterized protein LOC143913456 isoform X2 [Arctopsyche grandis]|uniref:uncharacterized protein LOC143913456 isoform X2 n=1 Tax=Arctopsyche grandis TaxID=121162 RepID=UPI00406D7BAF
MHRRGSTVLILAFATLFCKSVTATGYEQTFCTDLRPQISVDISQIMGMWYGVEVIPHLKEDIYSSLDTCPVIHLSEISFEMTTPSTYIPPGSFGYQWNKERFGSHDYKDGDYRHLRLYWEESGNTVEYYLKFNNTRKGFWMSSGPQSSMRGSMMKSSYNQFAGTIQVIKAVGDHLVLTICQRLPESQLFSVILSREPLRVGRDAIHGIHSLLNRRDLSTSEVRKVCSGGLISATLSTGSLLMLLTISIMSFFRKS